MRIDVAPGRRREAEAGRGLAWLGGGAGFGRGGGVGATAAMLGAEVAMRRQAYDRDSVEQYVEAVRRQLPDAALRDSVSGAATVIPGSGDPVDKVSGALPSARQAEPSSGGGAGGAVPYLAREPTVSLVQSA